MKTIEFFAGFSDSEKETTIGIVQTHEQPGSLPMTTVVCALIRQETQQETMDQEQKEALNKLQERIRMAEGISQMMGTPIELEEEVAATVAELSARHSLKLSEHS
jgi:hypothetical protein